MVVGVVEVCARNVRELKAKLAVVVAKLGRPLVLKQVVTFGCGREHKYVFEVVE